MKRNEGDREIQGGTGFPRLNVCMLGHKRIPSREGGI